jgi:hypothetical protein
MSPPFVNVLLQAFLADAYFRETHVYLVKHNPQVDRDHGFGTVRALKYLVLLAIRHDAHRACSASDLPSCRHGAVRIRNLWEHHRNMGEFLDCHRTPDRFVTSCGRCRGLNVIGVRINQTQLIDHFIPFWVARAPHQNRSALFYVEFGLLALDVTGAIPWGVYDSHVRR